MFRFMLAVLCKVAKKNPALANEAEGNALRADHSKSRGRMSLLTIQISERNLMPWCMPWTEAISRKETGVDEEMDIKQQKRKLPVIP